MISGIIPKPLHRNGAAEDEQIPRVMDSGLFGATQCLATCSFAIRHINPDVQGTCVPRMVSFPSLAFSCDFLSRRGKGTLGQVPRTLQKSSLLILYKSVKPSGSPPCRVALRPALRCCPISSWLLVLLRPPLMAQKTLWGCAECRKQVDHQQRGQGEPFFLGQHKDSIWAQNCLLSLQVGVGARAPVSSPTLDMASVR